MWARLARFWRSSGLTPTIVRISSGSAVLHLVNMAVGLITGMVLSRLLGAKGLGEYGIAMATASFLGIPIEAGMAQLIIRDTAKANRMTPEIVGMVRNAVGNALVVASVIAVAVLVYDKMWASPAVPLLLSVAFAVASSWTNIVAAPVLGVQKVVAGQIAPLAVRPIAFLLVLCSLLISGSVASPVVVMFFQVGSAGISLAFGLYQFFLLVRTTHKSNEKMATPVSHRALWRESLPIAAVGASHVLLGNGPIAALGMVATAESVGLYRVATSTLTMVMLPLTLLNAVAVPVLARTHASGDVRATQSALRQFAIGMTTGVAVLAAPAFAAGEPLLDLLFGLGFGRAAPELRVLIVGALVNAFFGANVAILTMAGRAKVVARAFAVGVIVLGTSLPPLVSRFDSMGAAVASTLAMTVWNVIVWIEAHIALGVDTSLLGMWGRQERP